MLSLHWKQREATTHSSLQLVALMEKVSLKLSAFLLFMLSCCCCIQQPTTTFTFYPARNYQRAEHGMWHATIYVIKSIRLLFSCSCRKTNIKTPTRMQLFKKCTFDWLNKKSAEFSLWPTIAALIFIVFWTLLKFFAKLCRVPYFLIQVELDSEFL